MNILSQKGRYAERSIWIQVTTLQIGMYVCSLDRPWLETPYPLEGVMIRSINDITTLSMYCDKVQIDAYKCWINVDKYFSRDKGKSIYTPILTSLVDQVKRISQTQTQTGDKVQHAVPLNEELGHAKRIYSESATVVNQIMEDVKKGNMLDYVSVKSISMEMVKSILRNPDALIWLSQLRNKDDYAYQHSINVCILVLSLGKKLALSADQLAELGMAGLMLDIGVLNLPPEILYKRGKLSPDEMKLIQSHVNQGLEILHNSPGISRTVLDTVAQHHERYDGTGYPSRLKASQISLFGGIAGVADCFDAMVSERPYSPAIPSFQALMVIYELKKQAFNPALVERFIQAIGIYPIGCIVELNSGEIAIVVEHRQNRRLKPKLLVILDANKEPYKNKETLDLLEEPNTVEEMPYMIQNVLKSGAYGIDSTEYFLL